MRPSEQYKIINQFCEQIPVNVELLAKALGIRVRYAYLDNEISGMLERKKPDDDKYVITVNALHPETRQRFTLAHELGHYMLHRDLIGDGVDDDRAYRSTSVGRYHNLDFGPEEETEANGFAAGLLMPMDKVSEELARGHSDAKQLAQKFEVSKQAMSIMLEHVNSDSEKVVA